MNDRMPVRPDLTQMVDGPDIQPDARPGEVPFTRTGFGSLPNPDFARPKDPRRSSEVADETAIEFEDGRAYTVIRTREERASSFSARTIDPAANVPYLAGGQDDRRTKLIISTKGGGIFVGTLSDCSAGQGFSLPDGTMMTTNLTDAIYFVSTDGAALVGLWMERDE